MKLLDNPFYILKCLPESSEKTILEQVKSKSSELDAQLCINSKNILLDPSKRLEAEISWFPGFDMDSLTKRICIVYKFFQKYISNYIFLKTNNYLAEANLLAFGVENEKNANSWNNDDIRLLISYLSKNSEKINIEDTRKLIESSRKIAKLPLSITEKQLNYFIEEQKKYYRNVLFNFIMQIDSNRINEILTDIIKDETKNGEQNCKWSLFEQVINDYETNNSAFFQKQKDTINNILEKMSGSCGLSLESLAMKKIYDNLNENLESLCKVAEPIKTLKVSKNQNYEIFDNIYYAIRELYLKACSVSSNYQFSYRLIKLCQMYFNEFINLSILIENDRRTLEEIMYKKEKVKEVINEEFDDNSILTIKDTCDSFITTNNNKKIYYNQINGYKFSNPDNKSNKEITLSLLINKREEPIDIKIPNNKEYYEKIKLLFWEKVGLLLTQILVDNLIYGKGLNFGKINISNFGVELTGKSFFMTKTKFFEWNEIVDIRFDNNEISIIGPGSFKVSESFEASYCMEVLELMLILFLSKGLNGSMGGKLDDLLHSKYANNWPVVLKEFYKTIKNTK